MSGFPRQADIRGAANEPNASWPGLIIGLKIWRSRLATLARVLFRAFPSASPRELLKQLALFCGAGLLVALLLMTYGLDLSVGFF